MFFHEKLNTLCTTDMEASDPATVTESICMNVCIGEALPIITRKLENDGSLRDGMNTAVGNIVELLEVHVLYICVFQFIRKNTLNVVMEQQSSPSVTTVAS